MLACSPAVTAALAARAAVVALETTIFSQLGLPSPANGRALAGVTGAIRAAGATPAVTAVLDGAVRIGLEPAEHERVLGAARKTAERDVAVAVAQRWPFGATTVSSTVMLAARAGIRVFATGGIGGVHRGVERSGDISSDLGALARYPVVTVCAGAKSFLDLPRTLEYLDTLSVPVIGFGTDEFPAFTMRTSGLALTDRADSIAELAAIVDAHTALGRTGGLLVCVPVPEEHALASDIGHEALEAALAEADRQGITGSAVTPFVLGRIADETSGAAVEANIALAINNARVAAELAVALADR